MSIKSIIVCNFRDVFHSKEVIIPVVCIGASIICDLISIFGFGKVWHLPRLFFNAALLVSLLNLHAEAFLSISAIAVAPELAVLLALCLSKNLSTDFIITFLLTISLIAIFYLISSFLDEGNVPLSRFKKLEQQYHEERDDRYNLILQFSLLGCLTNRERLFDQAFQILQKYFLVRQAVIYIADYTNNVLQPACALGYQSSNFSGLVIKVPPQFWNLSEYDPEKGMTSIIYGRTQLPTLRDLVPTSSLESLMALPLSINGKIIGLMNIVRQDPKGQRSENKSLLAAFGYVLASALNNCRRHESAILERDKALQTSIEVKQKQEDLKAVFGRYVSPEVVAELEQNPTVATLGGRRQKITVIMADLRGFTAMTTLLPLESIVKILNEWFERASKVILRNHGTIDKFMGDCIMILFGAPIAKDDDALRAAYTAVKLHELFLEFKHDFAALIENHALGLGISIATGDVVVGNFGSSTRMEYTAMGDAVNLAARLEKLAADGEIVVDTETFSKLQNRFEYTVEKNVQIKGKAPIDIYRLLRIK